MGDLLAGEIKSIGNLGIIQTDGRFKKYLFLYCNTSGRINHFE